MELVIIFAVIFVAFNLLVARGNGTLAFLKSKVRGFLGLDK